MKKRKDPIITLEHEGERELLFAALYENFGMWRDSFTLSATGELSPNPKWWRKREIFQRWRVSAVLWFCYGWIAATKDRGIT